MINKGDQEALRLFSIDILTVPRAQDEV